MSTSTRCRGSTATGRAVTAGVRRQPSRHQLLTVRVDLASQPEKTAVCIIDWSNQSVEVRAPTRGTFEGRTSGELHCGSGGRGDHLRDCRLAVRHTHRDTAECCALRGEPCSGTVSFVSSHDVRDPDDRAAETPDAGRRSALWTAPLTALTLIVMAQPLAPGIGLVCRAHRRSHRGIPDSS
jgi:hypothetical protein